MFFQVRGRWIRPGVVHKIRTADFDDGSLPSWLTLGGSGTDTGSSIAYTGASTSEGLATITTAASAGSTATLYGPEYDPTKNELIRITCDSVRLSSGTQVEAGIGVWSTTSGAQFYSASAEGGARWRRYLSDGTSNTFAQSDPGYKWLESGANDYGRHRTITFWLWPKTKYLAFGEGGADEPPRVCRQLSSIGNADPLRVGIYVKAASSSARSLSLCQLTVDRFQL